MWWLLSRFLAFALLAGFMPSGGQATAVQEATLLPDGCTVAAKGLLNPRFIAIGSDGALYISESGVGGDDPVELPEEFLAMMAGEEEGGSEEMASPESDAPPPFGRGTSGQVTMVAPDGTQTVVASGLPSYLFGFETIGPAGIAVGDGNIWLAVGGSGPLAGFVDPMPNENSVIQIDPASGDVEAIANIGDYERANDPEPFAIDSNLYGLDVAADGTILVADAGGNALYGVDPTTGELSVLAVIPGVEPPVDMEIPEEGNPLRGGAIELDPVPTGVVVATDGTVQVGLLGAQVSGAGGVVSVAADGSVSIVASGLSSVVDVAVGPDGAIYAVQMSSDFAGEMPAPGSVVRIAEDGSTAVVLDSLSFPNGIAFDSDGTLYVVINAVSFAEPNGQVLRCELNLEEADASRLPGGRA